MSSLLVRPPLQASIQDLFGVGAPGYQIYCFGRFDILQISNGTEASSLFLRRRRGDAYPSRLRAPGDRAATADAADQGIGGRTGREAVRARRPRRGLDRGGPPLPGPGEVDPRACQDPKSTRLNSSHT